MKTSTIVSIVVTILLAVFLTGCASDPERSVSTGDSDRLAALEAEVATLKSEVLKRNEALKEELALIHKNLDGIRSLIEIEKSRADAQVKPEADNRTDSGKLDDEINAKAKSFVNENLDRLVDITKKLLDKMEKEIDEQMKKNAPAPEGDEI